MGRWDGFLGIMWKNCQKVSKGGGADNVNILYTLTHTNLHLTHTNLRLTQTTPSLFLTHMSISHTHSLHLPDVAVGSADPEDDAHHYYRLVVQDILESERVYVQDIEVRDRDRDS